MRNVPTKRFQYRVAKMTVYNGNGNKPPQYYPTAIWTKIEGGNYISELGTPWTGTADIWGSGAPWVDVTDASPWATTVVDPGELTVSYSKYVTIRGPEGTAELLSATGTGSVAAAWRSSEGNSRVRVLDCNGNKWDANAERGMRNGCKVMGSLTDSAKQEWGNYNEALTFDWVIK